MKGSGYLSMEPSDLESKISSDQGLDSLGSVFTDPSEEDLPVLDSILCILPQLPAREADFVDLYFFKHCKQTDIANIFRVSQPTVCYRLRRAVNRIQFLLRYPALNPTETAERLKMAIDDPVDVSILLLMYETTCQLETARRLNVSQGLVRHRFFRSIKKLQGHPQLADLHALFHDISQNLNILREVRKTSKEANHRDDPIIYLVD